MPIDRSTQAEYEITSSGVPPTVTAVVLAYGDEPWLEECINSLLASQHVELDVVVVDNGCREELINALEHEGRVAVLRPGRNLGFAGGCNLGAAKAEGEVLVFINSDAIVDSAAVAALRDAVSSYAVGLATASLRLADTPGLLNSAGNTIHFLGFSWSGHFREPAEHYSTAACVAGASGAAMAIRASLWHDMGGFSSVYFAYHEDTELSLRCWQRGLQVVFVPDAVVLHHYEFSRNREKLYLIERNRMILVMTLWERSTLLLLAPLLIATEFGVLVLSILQGWGWQKVSAWGWILKHRAWVGERRLQLQEMRRVSDRQLHWLFTAEIDPANFETGIPLRPINVLLSIYWKVLTKLQWMPYR